MPRDPPVISAIFPWIHCVSIGIKLDRGQTRVKWFHLPIGMKSQTAPALPGRPRAFDADVALERAMHVLWAKRYEGASIHYPSVIRPGLSRLQMRTCSRALYPTSSLSSSVSRKLAQHIHDAVHPPGTILDRFSRSALRPSDTHCSTLIGFIGMVRGSNPSLASTAVFVSGGGTTVT